MRAVITKSVLVGFMAIPAFGQAWPPEPILRERAPKIIKIDDDTSLCEVHWDGYIENGDVIDISQDAPEDWTEGLLLLGSGEVVMIHTQPLQIFGEDRRVQFVAEGEEVTATIEVYSSFAEEPVIEITERRPASDMTTVYRGRVFCP